MTTMSALAISDPVSSVQYLNAHPDQISKCVELALLGEDVQVEKVLPWVLYIICGEDPRLCAAKLMKMTKSGVCGMVWKSGQTAYKCKTCELDPTWYVL